MLVAVLAGGLAGCQRSAAPPRGCSFLGIDVSRHQGPIDWPRVADAGVRFVWIKATEGGDYRDPLFRRNWLLSDAAGLRRGAYHFVTWCRPADQQAAWFVANVPADPDALTPVLDVEWTPGSRNCPNKIARDNGVRAIETLVDALRRAYGREPLLYAPADIYAEIVARSALERRPLWARSLHTDPTALYGHRGWSVWQYSETGRVSGIAGDVDLDCVDEATAHAMLGAPDSARGAP